MIIFTEKNDRLYIEFHEPKVTGDHTISMETVMTHEIDVTAHIERAVGNVLSGPLRELIDSWLFASLPEDAFGKKPNVD